MVIRIIFFLLLTNQVFSQSTPVFRIYFTDKNNSTFTISQPEDFLSQKSILRRSRYAIPIDTRDLPINKSYIDTVLSYPGVVLKAKSKWMNSIVIETDSATFNQIISHTFIDHAERLKSLNATGVTDKLEIKTQKRFDLTSDNYYGEAYDQIQMHNGHRLHQEGFDGTGMTIAVMDAGFPEVNQMPAFSSLYNENRVLGTYNFVTDTVEVYANTHTHGSLVLSCMATELPYTHVGTSPKSNYYFFVTEDAATESPIEEDNWVEAAEFADSVGVDLINTSLGYTTFDDSTFNHSYAEMNGNTTFISRGADIAASRGMLVVASAGNNGSSSWFHIGAPGDADSIMTVGAVGKDRLYADFSSKGYSYDGDVKPNIAAQGYLSAVIWPGATNVTFGSGTSFSSPIACGLTACLWQAHPDKNNMEIINAIQVSSSHFSSPDSLTGYGIPDFYLAHRLLSGDEYAFRDFFVKEVFPNPFHNELYLDVFSGSQSEVFIQIYSITGQLIFQKSIELKSEMLNRISLFRNDENLSYGLYLLHIHSESFENVYKIQYLKP